MADFIWHLAKIRIRLISADIHCILRDLAAKHIQLEQIIITDALTAEFTIYRKDYKKLNTILKDSGVHFKTLEYKGIYWKIKNGIKRPILLVGLLLFAALSIYMPSRILFVEVIGNSSVPEKLILEKANLCGIRFGASRAFVRSEKIKNALLNELPDLQWAGVNTKGCVAVISVKEKIVSERTGDSGAGISSIVAVRDGVILECVVTKGTPLCVTGQAVKAGQTLVSGYTDCGLSIQAVDADAEIYGLTSRNIRAYTPRAMQSRGKLIRVEEQVYIQIGKKVINFYNNSRISDPTCVKIEKKESISLPGDFALPAYRITQTYYFFRMDKSLSPDNNDGSWLSQFSREYIMSQMIAGQILNSVDIGSSLDDVYVWEAEYACKEMIGIKKQEEIIQ